MATQIWCLFSFENAYDQPENNLAAWWNEKPNFDALAKALGLGAFPCGDDQSTLYVVNLWQGKGGGQIRPAGTSYRLEQVSEGWLA